MGAQLSWPPPERTGEQGGKGREKRSHYLTAQSPSPTAAAFFHLLLLAAALGRGEKRRKGGGVFCLLFPPVSLFLPLLSLSLSVPRFPFFFGKERREKGGRREQPLPPPPSPPSSPFSCSSSVVSAEITRSPSLGPREIRLATSRSKSKNRSGKSLGKRDGKSDTADGESPLTSSVSCSSGGPPSFLAESL